jgi:hypothetical protein
MFAQNKMNDLVRKFLEANKPVDTNPEPKSKKGKGKTNVMEKPQADSSVNTIITTKPSKKVVMEFLREEIARLLAEDSD